MRQKYRDREFYHGDIVEFLHCEGLEEFVVPRLKIVVDTEIGVLDPVIGGGFGVLLGELDDLGHNIVGHVQLNIGLSQFFFIAFFLAVHFAAIDAST